MLDDQKYFLDNLVEFLTTQKADALIIAGDIFDRAIPSAEAVSLVDSVLKTIVIDKKIPVLAIAGNHDSPQRLSFANSLMESSGLYIEGKLGLKVKKVTLNDEYGEINFYLMPYIDFFEIKNRFPEVEIKTYNDAIKCVFSNYFAEVDYSKRNVLIAHGYFRYLNDENLEQDNIIFTKSETNVGGSDLSNIKPFENFDYIALGHLHSPQQSKIPNIRYAGSLLKYSVDESNQRKCIVQIELGKKGEVEIVEHTIAPKRDLRQISGDFGTILSGVGFGDTNDYIYVNILDDEPIADAISRLKSVYPNIMGLKYNNFSPERVDVINSQEIKNKSKFDLFNDFYSTMTGQQLNDEQTELINEIISDIEGAKMWNH